jgi:hypothetical protein
LAKPEDAARAETRAFLLSLRDALNGPALRPQLQDPVDKLLDLLGEGNIDKRLAARDRLDAMVAELDGRADAAGNPPPLVTRPHDWSRDQ